MKIKTFPLQMTEEFLEKAKKAAKRDNKPLYQWIIDLISKKL